jgi:NADH dehydrogenase
MILVAGGTGTLGREIVRGLRARDLDVRVLTRDPGAAVDLAQSGVEIVTGDVRDVAAVDRAVAGTHTVISAVHGFTGSFGAGPKAVDRDANRMLIDAARAAGCERFVLLSILGAAPDHPMDLGRMKYAAEQALRTSGLQWTIVRSAPFIETWVEVLGAPIRRNGDALVFGRGENPINFASVRDVAAVVESVAVDGESVECVVDVGGPDNVTLGQFARTLQRAMGASGAQRRVPRPVMRVACVVMRPFRPALARQIRAGVVMDTTDMAFAGGSGTSLDDAVARVMHARSR